VLNIATVHHGSPRWIEIQTRHLREHISVPYRTWSSLEGIDPSYGTHFDRIIEQQGPHAGKLNHLAIEISSEASDDDLLMFLDGDAFRSPTRSASSPMRSRGLRCSPCGAPRTWASPSRIRASA
jgi:hypothetical protein